MYNTGLYYPPKIPYWYTTKPAPPIVVGRYVHPPTHTGSLSLTGHALLMSSIGAVTPAGASIAIRDRVFDT